MHNTGKNLDAVTAATDSFKMADAFAGDRTGGAALKARAQAVGTSMWQGRVLVCRLLRMHGSGWLVVVRVKSAIVEQLDELPNVIPLIDH